MVELFWVSLMRDLVAFKELTLIAVLSGRYSTETDLINYTCSKMWKAAQFGFRFRI